MTVRPDYRYWALRELWEVSDGAHLLLGIRSGSVMSVYQLGQISTIMDWVQDAIDIRTLKLFSSAENSKPLEDRRVRPTEFLKWWQSKGRTVPAELAHLLETPIPEVRKPPEQTAKSADRSRSTEKTKHQQQERRTTSGEGQPGDLKLIVDDINEAVTVFSTVGSSKGRVFTRRDIVGRGTATWSLLVAFAKCKGSLEDNTVSDVKKLNTSVNRKNLSRKLIEALRLERPPIIQGLCGVMCFHSIKLAGGPSSADALDRKGITYDDQTTAFLVSHGDDMPPID